MYEQALILLTFEKVYKLCNIFNFVTDDKKIAGCWNLVLNSSIMKYLKKYLKYQHVDITFLSGVNSLILSLFFFLIIFPKHFSFLYSFLSCNLNPCSGCSVQLYIEWIPIKNMKIKNKENFFFLLKINKWEWEL